MLKFVLCGIEIIHLLSDKFVTEISSPFRSASDSPGTRSEDPVSVVEKILRR